MHWAGGFPLPSLRPLSVWDPSGDILLLAVRHPSHSPGSLAPYRPPAAEAGEAPAIATVLASHEPGFWLSGAPPVGMY
ncbi:hypothetical protein MDA_GLEAN10025080 [Myotis davidii]|uniref:Uncharacterized protein n=1 Tax=Myotis davidii TaxID=225400 RepID=L5M8I7_MYODS|nr:hypothetical protein MDA_GLEAN10025080 [Myotis davidii]